MYSIRGVTTRIYSSSPALIETFAISFRISRSIKCALLPEPAPSQQRERCHHPPSRSEAPVNIYRRGLIICAIFTRLGGVVEHLDPPNRAPIACPASIVPPGGVQRTALYHASTTSCRFSLTVAYCMIIFLKVSTGF